MLSSLSKNDLEIGDEVEFIINRKNPQKFCAESIEKIKSGTIKPNVSFHIYSMAFFILIYWF